MNFPKEEPHQFGYITNNHHYYWGIDKYNETFTDNTRKQLIYLGSTLNEMGHPDIETQVPNKTAGEIHFTTHGYKHQKKQYFPQQQNHQTHTKPPQHKSKINRNTKKNNT